MFSIQLTCIFLSSYKISCDINRKLNNSLNLGLLSDKAFIVETGTEPQMKAKWFELVEKSLSFIYIVPYAFEHQQLNTEIFVMAKLNLNQKSLKMFHCKIKNSKRRNVFKTSETNFLSSFQDCLFYTDNDWLYEQQRLLNVP